MASDPQSLTATAAELENVVLAYEKARDAGRPPSREELLARYPHLAANPLGAPAAASSTALSGRWRSRTASCATTPPHLRADLDNLGSVTLNDSTVCVGVDP